MQHLTYVVFINLAHYYGKKRCKPSAWSTCALVLFQTNGRGIWPGNDNACAHAYKIRKWRPSQRAAAAVCWKSLVLVQSKLWRRWVFMHLPAEIRDSFVLKLRWALQPILSYCCWTRKKEYEKWHFHYRTVLRKPERLSKPLACLWWSCTAFA